VQPHTLRVEASEFQPQMSFQQQRSDVLGPVPQEPVQPHTLRVDASEFQPQMSFQQQGSTMMQLPCSQEASELQSQTGLQDQPLATEFSSAPEARTNANGSHFQDTRLSHASLLPPTPCISPTDPPAMRVRSNIRRRSDISTFAALGLEVPYPSIGPIISCVPMVAEIGDSMKQSSEANNLGCTTPNTSSSSSATSNGGNASPSQHRGCREAAHSRDTNPLTTQRSCNGKKTADKELMSGQHTLQKMGSTSQEEDTAVSLTQEAFPSLGSTVPKSKIVPKGCAWGKVLKQQRKQLK